MSRASGFRMEDGQAAFLNGPTVNHLVGEIRTQYRAYLSPGTSIEFWIAACYAYQSSYPERQNNPDYRDRKVCERCNIATEYDMIMAPKPKVVI